MASELIHYDAARKALAQARRIDEVKNIRDKACAMETYARLAKDREIMQNAIEIRKRAEMRAGELLVEMTKNKGARGAGPGRGKKAVTRSDRLLDATPKLSDLGISKMESSRWQKLAKLPK